MFSINLFLFYYVTTVNIPFSDDFWFLDIVNKYFQADTVLNKISILRSQFNLGENPITHSIGYLEHRHTLIKILLVLQVKSIGHINIRHFMLLNCFALIFTFYYFFLSTKSYFTNQPLLLAACCAIYFSLVLYMNIFWFMSIPNNLLLMFGFGALYYLKNNRFYFAIIFMALSLSSSYGGILFFCISSIYLFIIKDYRKMFVLILIS